MFRTEHAVPDLQSLSVQRLRLVVLVFRPVYVGQIVHAIQSVGMLRTQHPLLDRKGGTENRPRLLILAFMPESTSQMVQCVERLRILRTPNTPLQIERAFQLFFRL